MARLDILYSLAGSRRAEREVPLLQVGLANSAEFAGVATQSQQDESRAFAQITFALHRSTISFIRSISWIGWVRLSSLEGTPRLSVCVLDDPQKGESRLKNLCMQVPLDEARTENFLQNGRGCHRAMIPY